MRKISALKLLPLILPLMAIAQTPPAFEVASIKPNKECRGPYRRSTPGNVMMNCYSIQELVAFAWGLRDEYVVGQSLPVRYNIIATFDAGTPVSQVYGPMLQALLEDRFALKLRRETRDMPVYNLTVAKKGPRMPPAKGDCVLAPDDGGPSLPKGRLATPIFFCNHPNTGIRGSDRTLEGKGITMKALADMLGRTELRRLVVDKTELAGEFDVALHWELDPSNPLYDGLGGTPISEPGTGPSLFTAVEEQLGLRLQSGHRPDQVLVIDRVETPQQ